MRLFIKFLCLTVSLLIYQQKSFSQEWEFNNLIIQSENSGFKIGADSFHIPTIPVSLNNIGYKCKSSNLIYPLHVCQNAEIYFDYLNKQYHLNGSTKFNFERNQYELTLVDESHELSIHYSTANKDQLEIQLQSMPYSSLLELLKPLIDTDEMDLNAEISSRFILDISTKPRLFGEYQIKHLNYEGEYGNIVLADCEYNARLDILIEDSGINIMNQMQINSGEALFHDLYANLYNAGLTVTTSININSDMNVDDINVKLKINDKFSMILNTWDTDFSDFTIDYNINDLSEVFNVFLKSWFEIVGFSDFEIEGKAKGRVEYINSDLSSLSAQLTEIYILSDRKKLEVTNLNGIINWNSDNQIIQQSNLNWDSLLLAGMPVNKSGLIITTQAETLDLKPDTQIPVFDGIIHINNLRIINIFQPSLDIDFDGVLYPVSLALITEKMGWPVMQGTISGKIPGMKKNGSKITFDGQLQLNVFDGDIEVDNLTMERLFGIAPVIAADVSFNSLNLQKITSTYDFGEITGLIKGYIKGLRITNWKPDRLNAYIETESSDSVKQYISQRAVDNISSIGGMQGAISRSFLRFFDRFKYKRLGIGCKLRNSVCEMSGLKEVDNRYFLIEGKGLPAINIIGISKFIDWEIFLNRLLHANY